MPTFVGDIEMRLITCECGITWAAPEKWFKKCENSHKTFNCPNGCRRYFPQESDKERLARLLETEREYRASAQAEAGKLRRSLTAYKGFATKLKRKS